MIEEIKNLISEKLESLSIDEKIDFLNQLKLVTHELSPFKNEPVDCVLWVKLDNVQANQYNPNAVAPPEMELLRQSISADGYTQPIVGFLKSENDYEIVDGFHRHRVGREVTEVRERVLGYLPIVKINSSQECLGLKQITGLASLFTNKEFSDSWEAELV
jgi:hypothetical protein